MISIYNAQFKLINKFLIVTGIGIISLVVCVGCRSTPTRYALEKDTPPLFKVNIADIPDAVPRHEPLSRYGNLPSYTVLGKKYHILKSARGYRARGLASWYGMKFHTYLTSSLEPYDLIKMTAAHKTLPLPTYVRVKNLHNGKEVIVRVNDRGPFVKGRIIDLSYAAAKKLDMLKTGTAPVEVRAITPIHFKISKSPAHAAKSIQSNTPIIKKAWLQVGSFRIRYNATQSLEYIQRITHTKVKIQSFKRNHTTFYRLMIGPFENEAQSEPIKKRLLTYGFKHVIVRTL